MGRKREGEARRVEGNNGGAGIPMVELGNKKQEARSGKQEARSKKRVD
jgi:hypothetical protein